MHDIRAFGWPKGRANTHATARRNRAGRVTALLTVGFVLVLLAVPLAAVGAHAEGRTGLHDLLVNPAAGYQHEPAPMGVADYGINPQNGSAYTYVTTEFQGSVRLDRFRTMNNSLAVGNGSASRAALQLNAVLVFWDANRAMYSYWTQTLVYIDTATNAITDYRLDIFNFSDPYASMATTNLCSGPACSTSLCTYQSGFACDLPMSRSYVNEPIVLDLQAGEQGGVASVSFAVNGDAYASWYFPFAATNMGTPAFAVTGVGATPTGSYYDAELVVTGPGNLSNTTCTDGSMTMELRYLPLHGSSLVEIPHAFNHGGDTGEGIGGVNVTGTGGNATLRAGSSSLGPLTPPGADASPIPGGANGAAGILFILALGIPVVAVVLALGRNRRRRAVAASATVPAASASLPATPPPVAGYHPIPETPAARESVPPARSDPRSAPRTVAAPTCQETAPTIRSPPEEGFFCSRCGTALVAGSLFCRRCGASTWVPATPPCTLPARVPSAVRSPVRRFAPSDLYGEAPGFGTTVPQPPAYPQRYCLHCGAPLSSASKSCGSCGAQTGWRLD